MPAIEGFEMVEVGQPLRPTRRMVDALADDEVLIRVAGCGLCHTDLGFLFDGVRTRHPLPLILGHEVAGVVEQAGARYQPLVGQAVVVPAVIPCGECALCRSGASMICRRQVMPGNDRDGGFASHLVVPGYGLCPVSAAGPDAPLGEVPGLTLRHLAVIADAVSTPYQAVARAGVGQGSLVVVVGLGGVGSYAAQIARAKGAFVVGVDTSPARRDAAAAWGVGLALDPVAEGAKLRRRVQDYAREVGAPDTRWVILECSGVAAGQNTAFGLLVHGATLMVVGFTMDKVELRLSNLMAFDARALGNWGCAPELYPEIVALALSGAIDLVGNVELRPLDEIAVAMDDAHHHRANRRIVLVPPT